MTFLALCSFPCFPGKTGEWGSRVESSERRRHFCGEHSFWTLWENLFKHLGCILAFVKIICCLSKWNNCKFQNLYQATTASLLEESESKIHLKWPTNKKAKSASQEFVIRMDTPLSETLSSNIREENKKIPKAIKIKCNQFDYAALATSKLRAHLKTHTGKKSYNCNQCDFASSQASLMKAHSKIHNVEKLHKCNLCDFASAYANSLRTHLRTHTKEKPFKCKVCDYA